MNDIAPPRYLGAVGEVRAGFAIDQVRLAQWLGASIPNFRAPLDISQFDGGQSNPTYLLQTGAGKYVLRRRPPGILLESAHDVRREYRVMRALFERDFVVPEPLALCLDESVIGSQFYVMRFVEGRIFLDCSMPDLSVAERGQLFDSTNRTLAQLHSLDPAALGLADFGRPGNYFSRQIARWSRQYEASRTEDIPAMERLLAWLPGAVPPDDGRISVIHGDISFHNLLVSTAKPDVAAVIDWELSTLGHPLGDLTYHLMEWYRPAGVDVRGTLKGRDLRALGIPSVKEYIERYCERSGCAPIDNLAFYESFNLFRVAAILQGVAKRVLQGNASATNGAEIAARVRPLAESAWNAARDAGAV